MSSATPDAPEGPSAVPGTRGGRPAAGEAPVPEATGKHPGGPPTVTTARREPTSRAPESRAAHIGRLALRALVRVVLPRLLSVGLVVFGAATLAFAGLKLLPGDEVDALLGPQTTASEAVREQIRDDYGFDRPVIAQYVGYLDNVVHLRFGESYQLQRPVGALISEQFRPTAELALSALLLAVVIAVAVATLTAGRRGIGRSAAGAWELLAVSTPPFWLGIVLLTVFSFRMGVFPVGGAGSIETLVLPAATLALPVSAVLTQVLRESMESALDEPFALTARARGLSRLAVQVRHILRHAALPLATLAGWLTGTLLGGAVLIEKVFARPGIGALTLQAVASRDMPVVMGVVLLSAVCFAVVSQLVDVLYLVIDPRLRKG
ncbi:ABC transporter permease [Yinghuangia sp. ASG 101]|uniref:ABC transporter permease n=1 Tax=Yinghuangia sp. ASG 101 TaxID=2896848 RepID=UPI001E5202D4|nr:ABC transporter permease [Yinghuangia sp. ASG 101]UGQ12681.1 ABC transporter permease [Yinghuangia sp. ASG 101]